MTCLNGPTINKILNGLTYNMFFLWISIFYLLIVVTPIFESGNFK